MAERFREIAEIPQQFVKEGTQVSIDIMIYIAARAHSPLSLHLTGAERGDSLSVRDDPCRLEAVSPWYQS